MTRFPIRRVDLFLDVAYEQPLAEVESVLAGLSGQLDYCLEEPAPRVRVVEFGASGMRIMYLAWLESRDFVDNRTRLLTEVKRAFDRAGIVIPYPQLVVHQPPAAP